MRSTRRIAVAMSVAIVLVAAWVAIGIGESFQEAPPTTGAYRATAYILHGGEWQIGAGMTGLATFPQGNTLQGIEVDGTSFSVIYGVTQRFQVGIAYREQFEAPFSVCSFSTKLDSPLGVNTDLGVPFSVAFYDIGYGSITFGELGSGTVLSLRVGSGFTLHGGIAFGFLRTGVFFQPYGIVDFDVLPKVKLVGELGLMPMSVAVGMWLRPLDFLDLKLALKPVTLSFGITFYLRF